MAFNWRKIFYPVASDLFAPHLHMKQLGESVNDIVPVANATEANQLLAQQGASPSRRLWIAQADETAAKSLKFATSTGGYQPISGASYYSQLGGEASGLTSALITAFGIPAPGYPYRVEIHGRLRVNVNAAADFAVILRTSAPGQIETLPTDIDQDDLRTSGGGARLHAIYDSPTGAARDFGMFLQRTGGTGTATVNAAAAVNRLYFEVKPL